MNISERIVNFRVENALSQREFAERAGLCKRTIARLEAHPDIGLLDITRRRIEYVLSGGTVKKQK